MRLKAKTDLHGYCKVEGLVDCEEFGFQGQQQDMHYEATQMPDWGQASKEEAPPPQLKEQNTLQEKLVSRKTGTSYPSIALQVEFCMRTA